MTVPDGNRTKVITAVDVSPLCLESIYMDVLKNSPNFFLLVPDGRVRAYWFA